MANKRPASTALSSDIKRRKSLSIDKKLEVIRMKENGEKTSIIGRLFSLSASTISTIVKNKDNIKKSAQLSSTPVGACRMTTITRSRDPVMSEMEKILNVWIDDTNARHCPISTSIIMDKAREIWGDLKRQHDKAPPSEGELKVNKSFLASKGWFDRFRKRYNLHNLTIQGETASADLVAAEEFPDKLRRVIEKGGYTYKQIFNFDETAMNWKKMPSNTYISKREKSAPGVKAAKARFTLVLGGNATGDFKFKPCLIHNSENPRALRGLAKMSLPVFYCSNKKAWMTSAINYDYMKDYVGPAIEKYSKQENIANKALLLVDNAPSHTQDMCHACPNVEVMFLPPNTSMLLQPMDQGVIAIFKSYYLRHIMRHIIQQVEKADAPSLIDVWKKFTIRDAIFHVAGAWDEVSQSSMNSMWRKLLPEAVQKFSGTTDVSAIRRDIVALAAEAGIEGVDKEGIDEVLSTQADELTTTDIQQLLHERPSKQEDDVNEEEDIPKEGLSLEVLKKIFHHLDIAINLAKDNDPEFERSTLIARGIEKTVQCYYQLLHEKKKLSRLSSLDTLRCESMHTTTTTTLPIPSMPPQSSTTLPQPSTSAAVKERSPSPSLEPSTSFEPSTSLKASTSLKPSPSFLTSNSFEVV